MVKIGFSTARNSPASFLLRKISGSRASHAWLLLQTMGCSERVALVLRWAAHPGGERLVPTRPSPQDLLALLRSLGSKDVTEEEVHGRLTA